MSMPKPFLNVQGHQNCGMTGIGSGCMEQKKIVKYLLVLQIAFLFGSSNVVIFRCVC
jgi:hypothetical protein